MLDLIKYIILGIIQGFTEPIPVSSSGHLLIFQTIISKFNGNFDVDFSTLATITNFGSLIAITLIYWKDIIRLVKSFFTYIFKKEKRSNRDIKTEYSYCWKIVVATIPAGIMGLIVTKLDLLDALEKNVKFVGLMLIVTAFALYLIKDFKGMFKKENMHFKDALIIGFSQMLALVPGLSRSGSTIVGGMLRGLKRTDAFDFSFILYIPISIATSILGVKDLLEMSISSTMWVFYLSSALMAFIFTYITTRWFSKIVKEGKLIYFSVYCLIAGILVIMFL